MGVAARSEVPSLLATVIQVEGSAYRKPGAMMWLNELGASAGIISGGCIEEDLKAWSSDFFNREKLFDTRVYDMRSTDDMGWGKGSGCNGVIHLLIERLTPDYQRLLFDCLHFLQSEPVLLQRKWDNRSLHRSFLNLTETLDVVTELKSHPDEKTFSQLIRPEPQLLIFGAGDDVIPLVSMAAPCHFGVSVIDPREAYCHHNRFPQAKACFISSFNDFVNHYSWSHYDAVVIMTHQIKADRFLLQYLLEQSVFYIGVLGNKKRTLCLLDGMDWPGHLHSPAGLSIGAEGPEEIAASIVAELIQSMHKKE